MLYLSQVLGTPVEDPQGVRIGKIIDITVPAAQIRQAEQPAITALVVEGQEDQSWRVPGEAMDWHDHSARLRLPVEQLSPQPETPLQHEVSLAHDVLDKQVIDIEHKKAIRVNDICLSDDWHILAIDNS